MSDDLFDTPADDTQQQTEQGDMFGADQDAFGEQEQDQDQFAESQDQFAESQDQFAESPAAEQQGDVYASLQDAYSTAQAPGAAFTTYPEHDNSALRAWEQEHEQYLSDLAKKSSQKRNELREVGKKQLEAFYAERKQLIQARKEENRKQQKEFVEIRDAPPTGNDWERVANYVDMKAAREGRDAARMRGLLLLLKQHPVPIRSSA